MPLCPSKMLERDERLLNHFSKFISGHKKEFVERVLNQRTRHLTVVLENIYQSQNASAVLRTCECMGLQDVYIIENTAKYQLNVRVLKGSDKWLTLNRYRTREVNNTERCFHDLRAAGYTIMVADPAEDGLSIDDVNIEENKTAIVFGNELNGASGYAVTHADKKIKIPMVGFTESLNISVSVAICLNSMLGRLRKSPAFNGLSEEEKNSLRLTWYRKIVRRSDILEREFFRTIQ